MEGYLLAIDYKDRGLKSVDIRLKFISLKCSWVKRLHNDNFHEWKLIPLYYFNKNLGKQFKFRSNLSFSKNFSAYFPCYYREILDSWSKFYTQTPTVPSTIASQFLWFNEQIKIDNNTVFFKHFSKKNINFLKDILNDNGHIITWESCQIHFGINKKWHYKWMQLIHAIPTAWKKELENDNGDCKNLMILNHHLIKNNQLYTIEKLISKELYSFSIFFKNVKPTSQVYFQNYFSNEQLVWSDIYCLPRIVTIDPKLRCFQYKILHNILYLNQELFIFGKTETKYCSFCKIEEETAIHLFATCSETIRFWNSIKYFLRDNLVIPSLSPQSAMFGLFEIDPDVFKITFYYCLNILFITPENPKYFYFQNFLEIYKKFIL